jgi:hypothetical protein
VVATAAGEEREPGERQRAGARRGAAPGARLRMGEFTDVLGHHRFESSNPGGVKGARAREPELLAAAPPRVKTKPFSSGKRAGT